MPEPVVVRFLPGCRGRMTAAELRRVARAVLRAEDVARHVGVEVVLADADTVRELNRLYRGRDEPTDVLSFASSEGEAFVESPEEASSLGEIIVCLPVAESQAAARAGASGDVVAHLKGEISHLVVHGMLHVLGYDHEDDGESAAMKEREDALLGGLGYGGFYAHGH